ncbi:MAG: S8 family serine peptidase [Candidatus Sericytochromatia bacterium]|nr:S8 family serine peptidase [Candidatus Sericytochromatia bacterium]
MTLLRLSFSSILALAGLLACSSPVLRAPQAESQSSWSAQAARFDGAGRAVRRVAVRLREQAGVGILGRHLASGVREVARIAPLGVWILETPPHQTAANLVQVLGREQEVVWAHPTVAIRAEGLAGAPQTHGGAPAWPNDPLVSKQTHLPQIQAFDAWPITRGEARTPLAILDTGIDTTHPEFTGRIHPASRNVLDSNAPPEDDYGHGNHVAGIAAAAADNGQGVAGVAPQAPLLVVKIMDAQGRGDDATFAAGLVHAVDAGARVVSMSFGAGESSPLFEAALKYALERDVLLVASAGNENRENDPLKRPHLPSTFAGVVEVAAVTPDDRKARFSNYGKTTALCAPGVDIFATYRLKFGGYGKFSGTSMATPMVAALATMVRGLHPDWSAARVREQLERTADDLGRPGRDDLFGAGRINCARAVGALP